MANVEIHVSSKERDNVKIFGNPDTACEYVSSRPNEDFDVWLEYEYEYKRLAKRIAQLLYENLDSNADLDFNDD